MSSARSGAQALAANYCLLAAGDRVEVPMDTTTSNPAKPRRVTAEALGLAVQVGALSGYEG
jgi:hypothetical protein